MKYSDFGVTFGGGTDGLGVLDGLNTVELGNK